MSGRLSGELDMSVEDFLDLYGKADNETIKRDMEYAKQGLDFTVAEHLNAIEALIQIYKEQETDDASD